MEQRQDFSEEKCFRETSRKTICKKEIKGPKGKILGYSELFGTI